MGRSCTYKLGLTQRVILPCSLTQRVIPPCGLTQRVIKIEHIYKTLYFIIRRIVMYICSYIPISPGEDPVEIMLHNLREADNVYNLEYFTAASLSFLKLYPNKNYQDLEIFLREKDFNTHLFVMKPKEGFFLRKVGVGPNPTYECFYSCRPKDVALQEVLNNLGTYESNFTKLAYAGILCTNFNKKSKSQDIYIFDSDQKIIDLITDNKIKIYFKNVPDLEFISKIIRDIIETMGKVPIVTLHGMTPNGAYIRSFTIDGKIVSKWGICSYPGGKRFVVDLGNIELL